MNVKRKLLTMLSTLVLSCGMIVATSTGSEADVVMIDVYGVYADTHNDGNYWPVTFYRDEQRALDLIAERATTDPTHVYMQDPVPTQFAETAILPSDSPDFVAPMPD